MKKPTVIDAETTFIDENGNELSIEVLEQEIAKKKKHGKSKSNSSASSGTDSENS